VVPVTAGPGDQGAADGSGHGDLRASHADREQVIGILKAAFVQGRLDRDELDLRVGQVLTSRTYAEQAAVIADLPAGLMRAKQRGSRARRTPTRAGGNAEVRTGLRVISVSIMLAALCWVIAIVAGKSEALFIAAVWTTGAVLAVSALTGSAALGPWLDKRRGSQPPRQLAGGQASQLPASAGPTGQFPSIDHGQQHWLLALKRQVGYRRKYPHGGAQLLAWATADTKH
jgi:Domain of unknown function (DUF1707)